MEGFKRWFEGGKSRPQMEGNGELVMLLAKLEEAGGESIEGGRKGYGVRGGLGARLAITRLWGETREQAKGS